MLLVKPSRSNAALRVVTATAAVVASIAMFAPAGVAHAHTAFDGSTPADGDVLDAPVSLVTLVFTGESEQAGDGFVVLDPSGQLRAPTNVSTLDNKVFTLTFDPPLAGGEVGVRWSVRAPDKHPIEGAFSFTVTADAMGAAVTASESVGDPTTTTAAASAAGSTMSGDMSQMSAAEMASMDEFLTVDSSRPGESQATLGRLLSFFGITLALGGVAFAATTLRGESIEFTWMFSALRIVGGAIVVGALIEYGGVTRIAEESVASYWSSSPGFATVVRVAAGLAIATGFAATTVAMRAKPSPKPLSSATNTLDLAPNIIEESRPVVASLDRTSPEPLRRWTPGRSSAVGFTGCGLALVSFWFDGHTVSKGFRPLHALANSVHVLAGSVWVGGVVAMAAIMWSRHRRGARPYSLQLVLRFSTVATLALGAVVAAGLVMAVSVLDSFGELTGTEWGQVLLLKSAAVGLALIGGAYNHFRLLPALEADPSDRLLHQQVRSVVTAEAIVLSFVVVVTAWLVAAAS